MKLDTHTCSKSELDLFSTPPVQDVIIEDYAIESRPSDPNNSCLEFNFGASSDDYTDLSRCQLSLSLKVTKSDGNAPVHYTVTDGNETQGADIDGVPVNLIFHSMWKQMDLFFNDDLVESSLDYGYKAYLTTLFSYSSEAKNTFLAALEGYRKDETGKFDIAKQSGAIESAKTLVKNGRVFELIGRPYLELFNQSRLIPNNVKIRLVMTRHSDAFCMMGFAGKVGYKIHIEKAVLRLRRCKLDPQEQLRIENRIAQKGAVFPTQSVVIKTVTMPADIRDYTVDSLFSNNEVPPRILIAQVDNTAYVGTYGQSPFNFKDNKISQASITYGGQTLSHEFDFTNKNKLGAYLNLYEIMSHYPCDLSIGVTKEDWEGGTTIIPFDLCSDQSYIGDFVSRRKVGSITLKLNWDAPLPSNTTLLIIGLFDNNYFMGSNRMFSRDLIY